MYAFLIKFCLFSLILSVNSAFSDDKSEIEKWCTDLSKDLMSVKKESCVQNNWEISGRSAQNKPIPILKMGESNKKRVMILGSLHGDEISSVSLCFRWLDIINKAQSDSNLKKVSYFIAPLVNIDGYMVRPRTRTNANGVDLNRNFNTKRWSVDAISHWKTKAKSESRRFPGKTAGSEVETQLVQKWIDEFKPEMIISVHAPYGLLDHDGPVKFNNKQKSPLPIQALGAFPGSLGQYAGVEKNIPVVTVELRAAKKIPDQKMIEDLIQFVLSANN